MAMKREFRAIEPTEVRTDEDGHGFWARVCNYGVPDSYNTSWERGTFAKSLETRLPKAVWSHQWDRPIGRVDEYRNTDDGLDVHVRLADFDAVPDARMAHSLLTDGIIDQFSFGFVRKTETRDAQHEGVTRITEADMDEISPVLVGSVPGTHTISVRSEEFVPAQVAADIVLRFERGDIDLAEALTELKTGGRSKGPDDTRTPVVETEPVVEPTTSDVVTEPDPDVEAAFARLNRSRR